MTTDDQSEKAQQLAAMVDADSNREGRALGFALGKFSVVTTVPVDDLLVDSTEIEEIQPS